MDRSITLAIDGYQFPGTAATDDDSEWLYVAGTVTAEGRTWSFRDPCLRANEFVSLVAWLKALSERRDGILDQRIDFMEPNLAFLFERIDPSTVRLTVALDLEAAPPGHPPYAGEPAQLVIDVTNEQLAQASADLAATALDVLERQRQRGQVS
jgi:hypothetical protein